MHQYHDVDLQSQRTNAFVMKGGEKGDTAAVKAGSRPFKQKAVKVR